MSQTPPPAPRPTSATDSALRGASGWGRRRLDLLMLHAHRLADRFERLPTDFGSQGPVDETDARAVLAEWRRCLRLWIDYNPEEVFFLKVGGGLLAAAILALWVMIGLIR